VHIGELIDQHRIAQAIDERTLRHRSALHSGAERVHAQSLRTRSSHVRGHPTWAGTGQAAAMKWCRDDLLSGLVGMRQSRSRSCRLATSGKAQSDHDHSGADLYPLIEVYHIIVRHADAPQ
jgi:hypothetical protein